MIASHTFEDVGWDSFQHDLRYAARGIRRRPGFAAIVVAMLALGIGANAIMFGVIDRLLLRPPAHVAEPDRVTRIYFREKAAAWLPGQDYIVLGDTARVVPAGLGLGFAVAFLAGRWVEPLLYQTSPYDPAVMAAVAATLVGAALAASFVPAWRASRVNPVVALRAE